jgi:sigma-B regulation protein RsbU (phosphoserine phosphatase)
MAWDAVLETPVLKSGTPTGVDTIAADLLAGRDGIRQMPHKGRDAMWVYGHVEGLPLGLLYVVPVDEIEIIADQAQESVRQAIVDQVRLAGIATVALTILVAVLSMLAARSVTSPLRELAATAHGLAQGNLEARATVRSSDEVGELATVFNAMVPELRQHIQVKESLALAREVQQKLLPEKAPSVPGFDIAGSSIYSEDVGGDYYDFIELADEAGARHLGIVVGDVAGHGIVAALTMTSVRVLLRSHADDGTGLKSVVRAVNRHLSEDATAGRFVTMVYMILDPDTRELRWVNAGHGPVFLYDPTQDTFTEMGAHDIPLGVKPDWQYQEQSRQDWPAGGVLVIGTDGIWEAQNPEGRAFGRDGMKHVIRSNAKAPAADICTAMEERLKEFSDGEPQRDDVTLVVVKFL